MLLLLSRTHTTKISKTGKHFVIAFLISIFNFNHIQTTYAQSSTDSNTTVQNDYFNIISKHGIMRWPANAMPISIYIKSGDTTDGYRSIFVKLLEEAFKEWSDASQEHVRFVLSNDPNNAKVTCSWTSDKSDMTRLTEGGHALVIPDGHDIKKVEIIILTKTINSENLSDQFFKRVALHEIGHTLGITDHSPDKNDMMYGAPPCTSTDCTLTTRDKNTLLAIYSLDQSQVNSHAVNIDSMLPDADNQSNLARIIRLNAEAAKAMQNKNLALAVAKLEEAHKIDPNNNLVNTNLGSAYGNCAVVACLLKNNQKAQTYFDKAIPLLAKGQNKENYLSILRMYENFLRSTQKNSEADTIEKKLKAASTH